MHVTRSVAIDRPVEDVCRFVVDPDNDRGTRLTQVSDVSFRGLGRLGRPLVALAVPRTMQQQLRDLKALLEQDARVG